MDPNVSCEDGVFERHKIWQLLTPNVEANRHFAVGRVWARLLKPKPGPPQSVRLSDQLGRAA